MSGGRVRGRGHQGLCVLSRLHGVESRAAEYGGAGGEGGEGVRGAVGGCVGGEEGWGGGVVLANCGGLALVVGVGVGKYIHDRRLPCCTKRFRFLLVPSAFSFQSLTPYFDSVGVRLGTLTYSDPFSQAHPKPAAFDA